MTKNEQKPEKIFEKLFCENFIDGFTPPYKPVDGETFLSDLEQVFKKHHISFMQVYTPLGYIGFNPVYNGMPGKFGIIGMKIMGEGETTITPINPGILEV